MTDSESTPKWLLRFFDGWDDPCPLGGENNGCDGLLREWGDPSFVNPPYSNPLPWVKKAISEARKGKRIVMLVRVDPSTRWWLALTAAGARFAPFFGRISFSAREDGSPNFASALVFL